MNLLEMNHHTRYLAKPSPSTINHIERGSSANEASPTPNGLPQPNSITIPTFPSIPSPLLLPILPNNNPLPKGLVFRCKPPQPLS